MMQHKRLVSISVAAIMIAAIVLVGRHFTRMPDSRSGIDAKMDQDVLAYEQWNDQHVVVFVLDNPERIYIDTIHQDWLNMGVPWIPRLQWTGNWAYVDATTDPASVGYGWGSWGTTFFGQVNDSDIVTIRCQMDTYLLEQSVASPGFAVKLQNGEDPPDSCDFLDSTGAIIWTAPVVKSAG